ncbi:hypothetical protein ABZ027_04585 [Streptomyces sp. NPDC006332]|uniref:hypothetical protein n=1 Tax=Streptomyces sp. NPDC006332 TaxID=3155456 RepID=UPI0033AAEF54
MAEKAAEADRGLLVLRDADSATGALGIAFGSLLRREVEGMFAIVMTSVIDLALQDPLCSSSSNGSIVRFLPSYGAMRAATGAGFSATPLPKYLAIQAGWFTATALTGLLAFHIRTRNSLNGPRPRVTAPRTADTAPPTASAPAPAPSMPPQQQDG